MYCYIFGAMPIDSIDFIINKEDIVIAADSGIINTQKFNIKPDYIIGDFDSLGYTPADHNTIVYPVEKDDTDTMLAVKLGLEKGYKNFRVFGGIGGRLDHTYANIQTASYVAENGGNAIFYGNNENLTVLKNNQITFEKENKGNISIFALDECQNVNIKGTYYELNNGNLSINFPLGTSNKFNNNKATISVENGKLLIIWERQDNNE
jgi:thiamine pyrophosphokinase